MTVCLLHWYIHFHAPWNADFLPLYFYWFISYMVLNSFLENRNGQYTLVDVSKSWRRLSIIHLLESPQANNLAVLLCSELTRAEEVVQIVALHYSLGSAFFVWRCPVESDIDCTNGASCEWSCPRVRDMLVHRAILKWLYPSTSGIEDALSKGCQDLSQLFSCAMNALPCTLHVFRRLKEVFICIT